MWQEGGSGAERARCMHIRSTILEWERHGYPPAALEYGANKCEQGVKGGQRGPSLSSFPGVEGWSVTKSMSVGGGGLVRSPNYLLAGLRRWSPPPALPSISCNHTSPSTRCACALPSTLLLRPALHQPEIQPAVAVLARVMTSCACSLCWMSSACMATFASSVVRVPALAFASCVRSRMPWLNRPA